MKWMMVPVIMELMMVARTVAITVGQVVNPSNPIPVVTVGAPVVLNRKHMMKNAMIVYK